MSVRIRRVICPVTLVPVQTASDTIPSRESSARGPFAPQRTLLNAIGAVATAPVSPMGLQYESVGQTIRTLDPIAARRTSGSGREPLPIGFDVSRAPLGLRPLVPTLGTRTNTSDVNRASALPSPASRGSSGDLAARSALLSTASRTRAPLSRAAEATGKSNRVQPREFHDWASARHQPLVVAQTSRSAGATTSVPVEMMTPESVQRLASDGGGGTPLPDEHRLPMEEVVGGGLRDARIHTSATAARTADALEAEAFTIGSDVFFGQGRYDPDSPRGRALLAHELVHVRQQTAFGTRRIQNYGGEADSAEAEAQAVERAMLDAGHPTSSGGLNVENHVRNYIPSGGPDLSSADVARLDTISLQAIEVCKQLLGNELGRHLREKLDRVEVEVSLDLGSLSNEEAAHIWGRILAEKVQTQRGTS